MNSQLTLTPAEAKPSGALLRTADPAPSTTSRTRRWLAGATLVTVGLVAGSSATYAFTTTANDVNPGVPAGFGAPPVGGGELGTLPEGPRSSGDGTSQGQDDGALDGETT